MAVAAATRRISSGEEILDVGLDADSAGWGYRATAFA